MAAEKDVWVDLRSALKRIDRKFHTTRIENALLGGIGTPDIQLCIRGVEVWIETKGLRRWPKVDDAKIIRLDHDLQPGQRLWHRAHWAAGGNNWVVLGIRQPQEWLIFNGDVAAQLLGLAARSTLETYCALHCCGKLDGESAYQLFLDRCINRT